MESAQITMEFTRNEKFKPQNELNDDVLTVVGRPGTIMKDWAMDILEIINWFWINKSLRYYF